MLFILCSLRSTYDVNGDVAGAGDRCIDFVG